MKSTKLVMVCPDENVLSAFAAGKLPGPDADRVDLHLDGCAECVAIVAEVAVAIGLAASGTDTRSGTHGDRRGIGSHELPELPERYVFLQRLGAGGMGVVALAHDRELDRRVAIKVIGRSTDDAAGVRLAHEAQAMARLHDPHVVTVYDVGQHAGRAYISMEYVEGATLRVWLRAANRSWRTVLEVLVGAGRGLAAAHAAGLVHRDFKPDNVIVDAHGRAKVTDFGLACAIASIDIDAPVDDSVESLTTRRITAPGSIAGTPMYMSLEQMAGARDDSRIDQFAFCVVVCEALWGARPFRARTLAELRRELQAGPPASPPTRAKIPLRLWRAIRRGLSTTPQERFADMDALLGELVGQLGARRRRVVRLGVAALAAGVGVGAYALAERVDAPCRGLDAPLAGVWDAARREAVQQSVRATALSFVDVQLGRALDRMDARAEAWVQMRRDACEATRVRGEQSELVLDVRMQCLQRRLDEIEAVVDLWIDADAEVAERLAQTEQSIAPLELCADIERLIVGDSASDPSVIASVRDVRARLAALRVLTAAGKHRLARAGSVELVADVDASGDRLLSAETAVVLAAIELAAGDHDAALPHLRHGQADALAVGDSRVFAEAAAEAAYVIGVWQSAPEEALRLLELASAAVDRGGGESTIAARVHTRRGHVLRSAGRYAEAEGEFERVLELRDSDEVARAAALQNLGTTAAQRGDLDRARDVLERALAVRETALGRDHPEVAITLDALANVHALADRRDVALELSLRALASREQTFGRDHVVVADSLSNLGLIYTGMQRFADAEPAHRRALAIREHALGPGHAKVAASLNNVGHALVEAGRPDEAEPVLRRALEIWRAALGEDHPDTAMALFNLGRAAIERGDPLAAIDPLTRALAIRKTALGEDHPQVASAATQLALAMTRSDGRRP